MRSILPKGLRILLILGTLLLMFPVGPPPPALPTASAQGPSEPAAGAPRSAPGQATIAGSIIQPFLTDVLYTPDPAQAHTLPSTRTPEEMAAKERANRGEQARAEPGPPLRTLPTPAPGEEVRPRAPSQGTPAFQGAADTGFNPPDPVIATGPNNLVVSANGVLNIFNKDGTPVSSQPLSGACPAVGGAPTPFFCTTDFTFDPWVVYDPYISRFWMLAVSCNRAAPTPTVPTPPSCGATPSRTTFQLALSDTSDASGTWRAVPMDAGIGATTHWCDYQKLGFDAQAIYISCNMFQFGGSANHYSGVRVMTKSQFLAGGQCCRWWDFWDLRDAGSSQRSFSVQPARMYGATVNDGMYMVNAHGGGSTGGGGNQFEVWRFTNVGTCCGTNAVAPTLTQATVTVRAYNRPPDARQPGSNATCNTGAAGTFCIDTGDARLLFAVWQNGLLSTGHTSSCSSGPATADSCIDFIELNVTNYPTITAVNDWELAAPNVSYYFPSVDVNAAGNKTMVYSRSSPTENPSTYFLGIPSSTTCTNCQDGPETLLRAGAATYVDCGVGVTCAGTLRNRWGDYLGAARDPDGTGIWIAGQASVANNNWAVQVGHTYGTPPPNNDNFVQRIAIPSLPAQFGGSTALATVQAGEPLNCRSFEDTRKTLWYLYQPTTAQIIDVDTLGSNFDTVLGVYTAPSVNGAAVNALTRVACNDDFGTSRQSRLTFPATAFTPYFIQVGGNNAGGVAASGNFVLNIRQAPAAPANDNFGQATVLPALPANFTVDTVSATTEAGERLACGPNPFSHTVWYRFTSPTTVTVDVDTRNSDFDTVLEVYTGNAVNALSEITCNDNFGSGLQSSLFFTAQAGVTYYIQVGGIAGAVGGRDQPFGNLRLNIGAFPPGNDNLVNIVNPPTSLPAAFTVGTTYATVEPGEPLTCSGRSFGRTVWYRYTSPTNQQLQIDTLGSDFDTVLSIYQGSAVNALTPVLCNDDFGGTTQSRVVFAATAGTTYQVQVGGGNGTSGNVNIRFAPGLATNDDFAQATPVSGPFAWFSDVTTAATTETGEPLACGAASFGRTVWYRFTPAATSSMEIHTQLSLSGAQFLDTVLAVYTGADLGALTPLLCNDDTPPNSIGSRVLFTAAAGVPHYVQVGGKNGASGTVVINFKLTTGNNEQAAQATEVNALPANFSEVAGGWYRFTAATTSPLTVSVASIDSPSSVGTVRVFTGPANALLTLTSSDDTVRLGGRGGRVVFTPQAGTTYHIQGTFSGAGTISFTPGGTIEIASQSAWEWFTSDPGPGQGFGQGFALQVCLDAPPPQPCPAGGQPWGTPGSGWNADLATLPPAARWIWRSGVTRFTFPADLQQYYFSRTFDVGVPPTSAVVQVAADDLAEIRVNNVSVGTVGSVTNRADALAAQNALQTFDIAPFLTVGTNRLTVRAQNGPNSFGPCAGGCNYQLNPAGVVFGGTIRLDAEVKVPPPTPTPIPTRTPVPPPGPDGAWVGLPPADVLAPRFGQVAAWAGANMIVWGGADAAGALADGARYSPAAKGWGALAPAPLTPRIGHSAVFTGAESASAL